MSDTKERTPEEIEAQVAKLRAEARQAEASAAQAEAEAARVGAQARVAQVEANTKERLQEATLAGDEFHHVYRFNDQVTGATAYRCIERLSEWHRRSPGCDIEIIFDSPGGSVHDGFALFDHIRWLSAQGHHITTGTVGMAASMAGVLMQAGDHRWAGKESWYLIHRAGFGAMGKTFEVEDRVDLIKRIEDRIINIFVDHTELTARKIKRNWERKDWWLSSDECLEYGIVDEIRG